MDRTVGHMSKLDFGKVVRERRMRRRWTQEEFADRAQISARHVQSLEAGTKLPTLDTVFKIARAFNTSPGPLLDPLWQDWR